MEIVRKILIFLQAQILFCKNCFDLPQNNFPLNKGFQDKENVVKYS